MVATLRIADLETSIAVSANILAKRINLRMHPHNAPCLVVTGIDRCTLANGHVLDWGAPALPATLTTPELTEIQSAGAKCDAAEAQRPAVMPLPSSGQAVVVAYAAACAGVPAN